MSKKSSSTESATSVDAVLFDIDGTLIDSSYQLTIAWARAFDHFGLHPQLWRIHRSIGMGGDKLVAAVTDERVERRKGDRLRKRWAKEYDRLIDEVRAFDGAADLVRQTRKRDLRTALATSGEQRFTKQAMHKLGLRAKDLDAITSSSQVRASKPAPDIFAKALQEVGGTRALVIADTVWDIKAADKIGAATICVRTGGFGPDELFAAGAIAVVDSVADLLDADWDDLLAEAGHHLPVPAGEEPSTA